MSVKDKLKAFRERAGISIRRMAEEAGYGEKWTSYRRYETDYKKPNLPMEFVNKIAPVLVGNGTPPITVEEVWLELAGGAPKDMVAINGTNRPSQEQELDFSDKTLTVREGDMNPDISISNVSEGIWAFPRHYIESYIPHADGLVVVRVQGNSMEPDFRAGDRVVVDTNHRTVSPDGVYVFWNGMGIAIKQLQFIPQSEPPQVRIISVNSTYPTDTLPLANLKICGRIVGRWDFL